jgi:hypothetical protein
MEAGVQMERASGSQKAGHRQVLRPGVVIVVISRKTELDVVAGKLSHDLL